MHKLKRRQAIEVINQYFSFFSSMPGSQAKPTRPHHWQKRKSSSIPWFLWNQTIWFWLFEVWSLFHHCWEWKRSLLGVIVFVCSLYSSNDLNPFLSFPPDQLQCLSDVQEGLADKHLSLFWHWKLWNVQFIALIREFNLSLEFAFLMGLSPVCITELIL